MKLKLRYKLKSGALQFTIFIGVLIALLLAGFILYSYTFKFLKQQSKANIENIRLSNLGISYALENSNIDKDTFQIPLVDKKENQSIKAQTSQWGIFEKVFVKAEHRKKRFIKAAIIGSRIDAEQSPTLYLQENYNPLILAGNTKIKGIVYLPSQGVRAGYIAGQGYHGLELIYGKTKKSTTQLPELIKNNIEEISLYNKKNKLSYQNDNIDLIPNQDVINSFKNRTKNIYSSHPVVLENINVIGNIIIKSDTLIKIKKSALLKDIIIVAPNVEVEDGTEGVFQVIATKKITIGKNCHFNYPSAFVLYQDNQNEATSTVTNNSDNKIFIDSGTSIKGTVCYIQTKKTSDFGIQIILEKTAKIKGQVYCNGNFEIKGTVSGSVFCKQFIVNQAGSIFINHICDGVIENENIPDFFGGLLFTNERKTIVKWLY